MLNYRLIRYFLASCSLTRLVLQEKLTSGKKLKKRGSKRVSSLRQEPVL